MLKNYTSEVASGKSVSHIEDALARHGAESVVKQYRDGCLLAISFFMQIDGRLVPFRLPARVAEVESLLMSTVKKPHKGTCDKIKEQSQRTAWKIISDWVDAQMALVELHQAEISEIFMPYIWNEKLGKSFYQIAVSKGLYLEAPKHA